jgi:hypothetical protein
MRYPRSMSVEELIKAVAELPPDQFAKFRAWFEAFENDQWDQQIKADIKAGKLDKLVAESEEDFRAGRLRKL